MIYEIRCPNLDIINKFSNISHEISARPCLNEQVCVPYFTAMSKVSIRGVVYLKPSIIHLPADRFALLQCLLYNRYSWPFLIFIIHSISFRVCDENISRVMILLTRENHSFSKSHNRHYIKHTVTVLKQYFSLCLVIYLSCCNLHCESLFIVNHKVMGDKCHGPKYNSWTEVSISWIKCSNW